MATLEIETAYGRSEFAPGGELAGIASWQLDRAPRAVELRLFWHTQGKGDDDAAIADTLRFEAPAAQDTQEFCFTLPEGPYSFSGKLISLRWALELVAEPSSGAARLDVTLSPTGREVLLHGDAAEAGDESQG